MPSTQSSSSSHLTVRPEPAIVLSAPTPLESEPEHQARAEIDPSTPVDHFRRPSLRKRRQRSSSSPELVSLYRRDYDLDPELKPPISPNSLLAERAQGQRPSSRQSHASGSVTGGSGDSKNTGAEDTLTIRRREANRLAAQRFRSRKKGYQDNLEGRIRILEEENDALRQRLGEGVGSSSSVILGGPSYPPVMGEDHTMTRPWHRSPVSANVNPGRSGQIQPGPYHIGSPSPERRESYAEGDVRIPALEAANRRLQEELRMSHDENDRLKEELAHWARWEAERRERTGTAGSADEFGRSLRNVPSIHSLELGPLPARSSFHTLPSPLSRPAQSPHPPLERTHSYSHPISPYRLTSPGIRLAPIRLPPFQSAVRHDEPPPHPRSAFPAHPIQDAQPVRPKSRNRRSRSLSSPKIHDSHR